MQGLDCNGFPESQEPFQFSYSLPTDQKTVFGCGPFTLAAGDSQSVWYAFVAVQAESHVLAVDSLIRYAQQVKSIFTNDLNSMVVHTTESPMDSSFVLHQNYPNPFNPSTVIRYRLAVNTKITLNIYNLLGQEVRTLVKGYQPAGLYSVIWDGKNNNGHRVSSGVYLYRIEAGDFVKTRKMILMK